MVELLLAGQGLNFYFYMLPANLQFPYHQEHIYEISSSLTVNLEMWYS